MFANEEQVKAVELMAQNERCVADLYRVYAAKFPEAAKFWDALVHEEEAHEKILRDFLKGLKKGELFSRQRVFSSNVWASIADIKKKISNAREKEMTLKEALTVAAGIESGILEAAYFRVVAGDSSRFESGFIRLAQDTERHQSMVKDKLAEYS